MIDDFFVRALIAAIGVAVATGPLGCFVIWRRMAYFGDATAHAALLGVAIALALSMSIFIGVLLVSLLVAITVSSLSNKFALDTLLGVISHSALAVGLVAVSFLSGVRLDLDAFLFGDVLAVSNQDLLVIWGGAICVLGLLAWRWSSLLTVTLNPELAHASGLNPKQEQLILTLVLAICVAVALKVVGALLISAMLIIPAAAARPIARTPEVMALIAVVVGVIAAVGGLQASLIWDTPAGPSIVCVAGLAFILTNTIYIFRK